ncbi:MAG: recombination protein RecR, partial [Nitrospiraceae bacterium]|nr:recombination protein RecR [Nitrospiraceae bacterium]
MLTDSPAVEKLIEAFRRLPGIGKRSAERLALHLLSAPEEEAQWLSEAVRDARARVSMCTCCRNLTEGELCSVCCDPHRDHTIICVVEHPAGAMAIEKAGAYRGLYHVLY